MRAARAGVSMLGMLGMLAPAFLAAQETALPADSARAPLPDTAKWIAVAPRPRSTVVAVTLSFPAGSADDEDGRGGSAWLLAQTLQSMAMDAIGPTADISIHATRNRFHASLVCAPEDWERDLGTLVTVLTRRDVSDEHFEAVRTRLVNRMTFEAGAPVREFETEAARLYSAGETEWSRPPEGDLEGLQGLTVQDLDRFRRRALTSGRAVAAVVGPVEAGQATATVARILGSGASTGKVASAVAWLTGERQVEVRDITNTALAFAYPLPAGYSRTEAEFLASVLRENLVSDPPDPGVYSVVVRVVDAPTGPVLAVEATVFPEVGDRWERKIVEAVEHVRLTDPGDDVYFPWQHRRFRAAALGGDAAPEDLALRLSLDLMRDGRIRDLDAESHDLRPEGLVALARSLGDPRILIFGPDLDAQQDR